MDRLLEFPMRFPRALTLLFGWGLTLLPSTQQPLILADGTPVRVRLNRNLSSAEARVGDQVDFDVVEDILANGVVIIQRGSKVLGTITDAAPKARMGKAGRLTVSIDYARSVLGEKIALRAVKENREGADSADANILDAATSIVTAPLSLFMKGKDTTIPKGTDVTAYVHGDVRLDESRFRSLSSNVPKPTPTEPPKPSDQVEAAKSDTSPQSPPADRSAPTPTPASPPQAVATPTPKASGMTNANVLALHEAGFSDDLIIAKIKSSRCAFRMEPSDMIELKKAGLSDRVISAMMDKSQ